MVIKTFAELSLLTIVEILCSCLGCNVWLDNLPRAIKVVDIPQRF